jgi:hypothetical protein
MVPLINADDEEKTKAAVNELDYRITSAKQKLTDLSANIALIIASLQTVESDYPELSILDQYAGSDPEVIARKTKRATQTSKRDAIIADWQRIKVVVDKRS